MKVSRLTLAVTIIWTVSGEIPGTTQSPAAAQNAVITLVNSRWPRVRVQAKRGKERPCQANPGYGARILKKGGAWSIPCEGEEICWRLLVLGFPDAEWGPWNREPCSLSKTREDL